MNLFMTYYRLNKHDNDVNYLKRQNEKCRIQTLVFQFARQEDQGKFVYLMLCIQTWIPYLLHFRLNFVVYHK